MPQRDEPELHLIDLARVVKFGIPGTSMPGHETLTDAEVIGVSLFVECLELPPQNL